VRLRCAKPEWALDRAYCTQLIREIPLTPAVLEEELIDILYSYLGITFELSQHQRRLMHVVGMGYSTRLPLAISGIWATEHGIPREVYDIDLRGPTLRLLLQDVRAWCIT
jgi:hypothetical protein